MSPQATAEYPNQNLPILFGAERDGFPQAIRPFRAESASYPRHVVNAERRTRLIPRAMPRSD